MINSILEMIKNIPEGYVLSGYIILLDAGASSSIVWYDNITNCHQVEEDHVSWILFDYENPDLGKSILIVPKTAVAKIDLSYVPKDTF